MALSIETLALAKKFTRETVNGMGAIQGAPCTIKSSTRVDGGTLIEFEWTAIDGTKETSSIIVEDGQAGVSIVSMAIDADSHLICEFSDGTIIDAGETGDASIDDSATSLDTTWSSKKIKESIGRWVGTTADFERVKATLPEGTIVVITDDDTNTSPGLLSFSTFREFPAIGNTQTLYIDTETDFIYRFNKESLTYEILKASIHPGDGIVVTPDGNPVTIVDNQGFILTEALPPTVVTTELVEIQGTI